MSSYNTLEFEGHVVSYRSDSEYDLVLGFIAAVKLHRKNGCWEETARLLAYVDHCALRSSCRNRLGYRNPRVKTTLDDVREAVRLHQSGVDPDVIADGYGISKAALFQRARNILGYYMSTKTFTSVDDQDSMGMWANILYSKKLRFEA